MPTLLRILLPAFLVSCTPSADVTSPPGSTPDAAPDPSVAPIIELAPTAFFIDGDVWWTANEAVTLTGAINAASMSQIEARIGTVTYAGTITGDTFTIALPAGAIFTFATEVRIVASNAAGQTAMVSQLIRTDLTPPVLAVGTSAVFDEAADAITFPANNGIPAHRHVGAGVDLATPSGCPTVRKHTYLLDGALSPLEDIANPIAYRLAPSDEGVGIVDGIEYRVGRRDAGTTTWLTDWTANPTDDVTLQRDPATGVLATAATYDFEARVTDHLGRATTIARCFDLQHATPPVWFGPFNARNTGYYAANHTHALWTMRLEAGAAHGKFGERLMRSSASTGASIFDMLVVNGTPDPAPMTVTIDAPSTITVSKRWVGRGHRISTVTASSACSTTAQANCLPPAFPRITEQATTGVLFPLVTRIGVFEWNGTEAVNELAATATPADGVYEFVLPPNTGTPKIYVVMSLVRYIDELNPRSGAYPDSGPYSDTTIDGKAISGRTYASVTGCTAVRYGTNGFPNLCTQRSTVTPYRALTHATLAIGMTQMTYAIAGRQIASGTIANNTSMTTTEEALPDYVAPPNPF